jgi:hypothetical protein
VVTTPAATAATTGAGNTRACGAVVVVSVGSGMGTVAAGLEAGLVGFVSLVFFVDFAGFVMELRLEVLGFTLTARVAAFIWAVRIEAVFIAVVRIAVAVRKLAVRRWALAGPMRPTLRKTVRRTTKRFRERRAGSEFERSGESVTPGNAFDMAQGYARDMTIR